ncbi:hypothetical protein K2173_015170 [Erythroxylum novogranatense]|uniref:Protein ACCUMULATION AND REPLICATION OF CHLOROPLASTS 3 n=1 Tax=Erythroxylum novogranatense TaxID=1862640 RepID=A0AAV8T2L4_9ROSI|nr:hypothetical protein K2173_015170 [Erythroxylum novogranatense]
MAHAVGLLPPVNLRFQSVSLWPLSIRNSNSSCAISKYNRCVRTKHTLVDGVVKAEISRNSSSSSNGSVSEFVEVIGIGSRKDSIFRFCLDSPFQLSSSVRCWNIIHAKDAGNVLLQEKVLGKDQNPTSTGAEQFLQSCSNAVILVASIGYGLDHDIAIDILKTIRSRNGFVVAILLKPFSFEGQRRQVEVKDLVAKLQDLTNFCIDIDLDTLLKKDLVTLDEALKTANRAVFLAINAISVLLSDIHQKQIYVHSDPTELKVSEITKILGSYKEVNIAFGAGDNVRSSILQALFDCPFICTGLEDLNGIVICIISSSGLMDNDVLASLHTFRQTANYSGHLIISAAYEPNLGSNMLVTTLLILSSAEQETRQVSNILSSLAHHFPFIYKLLRRHQKHSSESYKNDGNNTEKDARPSEMASSTDFCSKEKIAVENTTKTVVEHTSETNVISSSDFSDHCILRNTIGSTEVSDGCMLDTVDDASCSYDPIAEAPPIQREPLNSWNLGPGYQIAQKWAKEMAEANAKLDNLSIFTLPVGVRPPDEPKDSLNISYSTEFTSPKTDDSVKEQALVDSSISSWGALTEASILAMKDFYSNASTQLKSRKADVPKKQGVLSIRAASMLEGERDSPKKWSPLMEMQYRGGIYKGRCQGGLPEGKGRLILADGSIYDGLWHYGNRSGAGTFYFNNGDVFQGSWRDDVMHGKGWFYFHKGDRWFANFWKGKANGESHFYSKCGDVFFGQFEDGWRHGHFLCIDVDGMRCIEVWDKGMLLSRKQLDTYPVEGTI